MEEEVDLTGGYSDDDHSDVNEDAHATALAHPHQIQPQKKLCKVPFFMRAETVCS